MDVELDLTQNQILDTPLINKGTAFTQSERDDLGLNGYLPHAVLTIEQQAAKCYYNFLSQPTQLARFTFLSALQNRNEILFYRLICDHISEMLPYIYTPTVGDVSLNYSNLYVEHRGVYLSYPHRDKMEDVINSLERENIDVVVVTDGERVLGLGDVGIGGMAIPVGKLSLYSVLGGIHPARTLPVFLDVGTNNQSLLHNEQYLGWRHERVGGNEYMMFVERFVKALQARYPSALLQWEDFGKGNALTLLEKYQNRILSFNDDIQGTASVVLSAVISASKVTNKQLQDQKIVVLGGGSAGLGICNKMLLAMELEGVDRQEALKRFYVVDVHGLIHSEMKQADSEQMKFARDIDELSSWKLERQGIITLLDVVNNIDATILIGVSTQAGAFTHEIVSAMAEKVERPVILPLSNPTDKAEARPEDLLKWTFGRVITATGSPFAPVEYQSRLYPIAQCNNASIFPGLGLGVISAQAAKVTDKMFVVAARKLSEYCPMLKDSNSSLFPSFEQIREISKELAFAVGKAAQEEGVAAVIDDEELRHRIKMNFWNPVYPMFKRKRR